MSLRASHRRLIRWVTIALVALVVEETARYGLRAYSRASLRSGYERIPVSKSIRELALTYPSTLQVSDEERLTVEETIGVAISGCTKLHLMRRTNPLAASQLWDIIRIEDDGLWMIHEESYKVLGYIGDDSDAVKMVEQVRSYSGTLNKADNMRLHAIIRALGLMGLRGVGTAVKNLDEMSDVNYWKGRLKYLPDELMRDFDLPPELETACLVFEAQALWRSDEWPPKFKKMLAQISNEKHRQIVASRFDLIEPRRRIAESILVGQKRPTDEMRQGLRTTYAQRERMMGAESRSQRERDNEHTHPWWRLRPLPK